MSVEQLAPAAVAHRPGLLGGTDDIGEQHRGQGPLAAAGGGGVGAVGARAGPLSTTAACSPSGISSSSMAKPGQKFVS